MSHISGTNVTLTTMITTNIVNFNNVTINKEDVLETHIGKIVQIQENRYINESACKETNGKEMHEIFVRAKFILGNISTCQGWSFNADNASELEEFRNIGFKLGQEIIWYYMKKHGGNKFELVIK